ncbi:hypothetical protein NM208_g5492 [Fusarium decemcellulare]|uniref:Uncharacterized protein n=1 Tax=Fusarium decemcellulare TaxID=57161 RepID=A0ACC1SGR8_9HYPO|nr:hypothetical protein NM208_g5492 [Fusarium decemcellulare]
MPTADARTYGERWLFPAEYYKTEDKEDKNSEAGQFCSRWTLWHPHGQTTWWVVKMLPALFLFASLAAASVSNFDRASVPAICDEICTQVDELSDLCEAPDAKGRTKDLFETQCFCTNDSFDVEKITSLCAACIHEWVPYYEDLNEKHKDDDDDGDRDSDDWDDGDWEGDDEDRWYREGNDYSGWGDEDLAHIDRFMITCNFTSTTYSDDDWDAGSTATVQATPLRNMSQVTTTIAPAPTSDSGALW